MDVVLGLYGYPAVLLAHRLKLFPLLAEKPHALPEICISLQIAERPAQALLSVCASLGFIKVQNGNYSLTAVAEDYLLENSPRSSAKLTLTCLKGVFHSFSRHRLHSFQRRVPLLGLHRVAILLLGLTIGVSVATAQAPPTTRPTPPTRDPHSPGYVAATELPDGSNPPANADGNFIIGPAHPPAAEIRP